MTPGLPDDAVVMPADDATTTANGLVGPDMVKAVEPSIVDREYPMAGENTTTTDHDEIRTWAQQRGGRPAAVAATSSNDDAGIIRIAFPEYSDDEGLEEISWDEWFDAFDQNNLALVYQETTSDGERSTFNKLVARD